MKKAIQDRLGIPKAQARLVPILAAALLGGCHRHQPVATPSASAAADAISLTRVDLGVSMLAEIENARAALAMHDTVAAGNDIAAAEASVVGLASRPSKLMRSEPRFQALVAIDSAQSLLQSDHQAADAYLRAVQNSVPESLIPPDLPLVRAAASLAHGRAAASEGRTDSLKTQLACTRSALNAYSGALHQSEAKALSTDIARILADPEALATLHGYRLDPWVAQIDGWIGVEG